MGVRTQTGGDMWGSVPRQGVTCGGRAGAGGWEGVGAVLGLVTGGGGRAGAGAVLGLEPCWGWCQAGGQARQNACRLAILYDLFACYHLW